MPKPRERSEPVDDAPENAAAQPPDAARSEPKQKPSLAGTRLKSAAARVLLGLCGVTLFVAFFLPWVNLGKFASVSGFALTVSGGEVVDFVAGPHRVIPLVVPLLGALLTFGAFVGHRAVLWVAIATGVFVLAYGIFTLVRFFLDTTGLGVWLVVVSALVSLGVGLLGVGATRRS